MNLEAEHILPKVTPQNKKEEPLFDLQPLGILGGQSTTSIPIPIYCLLSLLAFL
jgi:hypothetical protein